MGLPGGSTRRAEPPEWFFLIRGGLMLGCSPWLLAEPNSELSQPGPDWIERAFIYSSASNKADQFNKKDRRGALEKAASRGHAGRVM